MRSIWFALLIAILAVSGNRASSQANVTENQGNYIYVDAQYGYDGNSGAYNSQLRTIQEGVNRANALNRNGIGVKVIVGAGVYRESVNLSGYNQTGATMTVQAASTGTAVISGSDVLTNWYQENSTPVYSHSWNYNFGECAIPRGWPSQFAPVARRTEMIFVNHIPLTQVMTFGDLRPGTFYVNEEYNVLHISPAPWTDMSTALVEAAVRPQTLNLSNRSNVVLRGLVFEHAANCLNTSGANVSSSWNVLIDSVQANWNNFGGLAVSSSSNVTVKNSIGNYNGGVGFQAYRDENVLYSYNETDYNNWRGAQAAFYDWAMGGTKMLLMRNTTVEGQFSYRNQAQGLWFDTDNKNITVDNATLAGNVVAGLQIEKNEGPLTLKNSRLCSSGSGINVLTSEGLTIENNTFYNNSGTNKRQGEIFIGGDQNGSWVTDWQTGQTYNLFTKGMVLSGNTFENIKVGQNVFGTYLSGADWSDFANSLNASNNRWYDPTNWNAFQIENGNLVNMWGWRNATGTDYSSSWEKPPISPAGLCTIAYPAYADFSVNADANSYTMWGGKAVATLRVNSFGYGPVSLWANGMPNGVSAWFSSSNLVGGAVTVTFTASNSAAYQRVPITFWAVSGARVHSVTVYVQVAHA